MDYAEAYDGYAAQGILQIDTEIVKKSHFWMETISIFVVQVSPCSGTQQRERRTIRG